MGEGSKELNTVLWEATAEKDGNRDSRVGIRIIWLNSEATVFLSAFLFFWIFVFKLTFYLPATSLSHFCLIYLYYTYNHFLPDLKSEVSLRAR